MPYAVTHALIPIILVDTIRDHVFKTKKSFLPNRYVLFAGIAGMLPDLDLLFTPSLHRTITHSIWFPLIFLFGFLLSYTLQKKKLYKIFLMLFVGFSLHILMDATLLGSVALFSPLDSTQIRLNLLAPIISLGPDVFPAIDAILLFLWLIHEELEHNISEYLQFIQINIEKFIFDLYGQVFHNTYHDNVYLYLIDIFLRLLYFDWC